VKKEEVISLEVSNAYIPISSLKRGNSPTIEIGYPLTYKPPPESPGWMMSQEFWELIWNIPNIKKNPLEYVLEDLHFVQEWNSLWLEFGVYSGRTINYISQFAQGKVYGFDSFEGLPEKWRDGFDKGTFTRDGELPVVNKNVELIKGCFDQTLLPFLKAHREKVSLLHLDADLYSSTKYILDLLVLCHRIDVGTVIVFDELVNFMDFAGAKSELRALHEWLLENPNIEAEWIGMNGILGNIGTCFEKAALRIIGV